MDEQRTTPGMGNVTDNANATLKKTLDQGAAGVAAVKEGAQATVEQVRSVGARAGAALSDAVGQAREQSGPVLEDLSRRSSAAGQQLSEFAASYPLTALLVAAAVGYGFARVIHWP